MTTIDCEGIESARESHYSIARVIRSLRVMGLKLHAKAVYSYFKQFGDEVGETKALWKVAMYGNKWKSYF